MYSLSLAEMSSLLFLIFRKILLCIHITLECLRVQLSDLQWHLACLFLGIIKKEIFVLPFIAISLCELGEEICSSRNVAIIDLSVSENDVSASNIIKILSFSSKESMFLNALSACFNFDFPFIFSTKTSVMPCISSRLHRK